MTNSILEKGKGSSFDLQLVEIKAMATTVPKIALQHIAKIESSIKQSDTPDAFYELSLLKGICYIEQSDLTKAAEHFDFCLSYFESSLTNFQKVRALNFKTQVEFRKNKFQQALITGYETLTLAKEINAFTEQALAYNIIGITYGALYAYEDSLDALLSGLELKEHLYEDLIYKLNNNTSNVYFFLGHYERALDTLKEAMYYTDLKKNARVHILSEMNFGKIYTKLDQINTATEHLEKAKVIAEKNPEHADLLTGTYQNLADLYLTQEQNNEAISTFQKAIKLANKAGHISYEANLLASLAQCYMNQANYDLVRETLDHAFKLSQTDYSDLTHLSIHKAYSDLHEHLGDYKTALEHYKRYHDLKEEVQNERSQSRMQGMMVKNDTERVQNEHARIANEKELDSLRLLKLEQDNKKLVEENTRDGLTGAYNRRYLNEKLKEVFEYAQNNQSPLSIVMCDIDFFKQVNDTFSHAIGDEVLKAIANIFMENTREQDTVARYGGEEFVVIFDRSHRGTAITIAEKLRILVEQYPWKNIHLDLSITISMGVTSGFEFDNYEAMLNNADLHMYSAKRSGKNQVRYA